MTVLKGVDSWQEPTAAQIASAKANGISVWAGYFKIGNDGIYHGWTDATFKLVQAGGLHTLAFCSTRANPAALKARAAALGIVIVADVESSVDGGDSPAVDPWLAASGAHLYGGGPRGDGTIPRHLPHGHTGYMLADYEQRGGWGTASWPTGDARPATAPVAWQYAGGGAHPWGNTDLGIYDEAFVLGSVPTPTPTEDDMLGFLYIVAGGDGTQFVFTGSAVVPQDSTATIAAMVAQGCLKTTTPATIDAAEHARFIAATTHPSTAGGGLTTAQDATLTGAAAGVTRLVAELHAP